MKKSGEKAVPYGLPWSEAFVEQLEDKEFRDEFVADQVRIRIALLIRNLREGRGWSQAEMGRKMGKPQSVVSRLENVEYGKASLHTLLEVASALDLPLLVDIPEWDDWFRTVADVPTGNTTRASFNAARMCAAARDAKDGISTGNIARLQVPIVDDGEAYAVSTSTDCHARSIAQ